MKKTLLIGLALGVVSLTATSAFAGTIKGTKHDLSSVSGYDKTIGTGDTRICIYCHHPHNSVKATTTGASAAGMLAYSPLWNRGAYDGAFVTYNNGTNMGDDNADGIINDSESRHLMNGIPTVGGVTLLCLSCHDGVTAMGAYSENNPDFTANATDGGTGKASGASFGASDAGDVITGALAFGDVSGVDLSNHHPVGMDWDLTRQGDPEIAEKTNTFFGNTSISIESVLTGGTTMECNACHDVHNTQSAVDESFIWTSNTESNFCLTCHVK